jgi:hypothetical protein
MMGIQLYSNYEFYEFFFKKLETVLSGLLDHLDIVL